MTRHKDESEMQRTKEFLDICSKSSPSESRLNELFSRGIDVQMTGRDRCTPLHSVVRHDMLDLAMRLLRHGASLSALTDHGFTPLHLAVQCGKLEIIRAFLSAGASIEARTNSGDTPLLLALNNLPVDQNRSEIVKFLLSRGANIYAENSDKMIPLHYQIIITETLVSAWQTDFELFVKGLHAPQTTKHVYHLLTTWPLADPAMPVDRMAHLIQLFVHAGFRSTDAGKNIAINIIADLEKDGLPCYQCSMLRGTLDPSPPRPKPPNRKDE